MEEKIFDNLSESTVEKLVKKINEVVEKDFSILDEENDIEKWNTLPKLLLLNKKAKTKLLSFVEFMDSLFKPIEEKTMYVVSLCGLLEFEHLNLNDYDEGSLFTLADYYQNSSIKEIEKTINLISNKDLLFAVRTKTLDLDDRKKILDDIVNCANDDKIDITNLNAVNKYVEKVLNKLEETEIYELIK